MPLKPEASPRSGVNALRANVPDYAEPEFRQPLVLVRDTERSLRLKTVETLSPLLPEAMALNLSEASLVAEESLEELAAIALDEITDEDLQPALIQIGLVFVAFSSLAMAFLLLFLYVLHPEMTAREQLQQHWHEYVWFVSFGISGLFMLGREAMRPRLDEPKL